MQSERLNQQSKLFETVIEGGYCIGCGACSVVAGSTVQIKLNEFAQLEAFSTDPIPRDVDKKMQEVCPFSSISKNEDEIAKELFEKDAFYHPKVGYHIATYAGYVSEGDFRKNGSSGGFGTWILIELLQKGLIDSVINVQERIPSEDDKRLFQYQLATTDSAIISGSKSKYYPVELSSMVNLILKRPGRYAIVGIPCFIKSIRLLANQNNILKDRIKVCVGLICGHLKSARYAEMLAWQCGIHPNKLNSIDFRTKLKGFGANQYGITVSGLDGNRTVVKTSKQIKSLYGSNWGQGFFKYKACDYCDDVVAETAEITIGDAWLPQYVKDTEGTNIIIIRNPLINSIVRDALIAKRLVLDSIDVEEVVKSQSGGFAHRREGLAYRLYIAKQENKWYPPKRVAAKDILNARTKKIQILRQLLLKQSHMAFIIALSGNAFSLFVSEMKKNVRAYEKLYQLDLWARFTNKFKKILNK